MGEIPHPERLQRPKAWFRVWAQHTINGTTFQELGAGPRAVWFSIMCFACDSREPGIIGIGSPVTMGYTNAQLAAKMYLDIEVVKSGIKRLIEVGKINLNSNGVIEVVKWKIYQSPMDTAERKRSERAKKQRDKRRDKDRDKKGDNVRGTEVTEVTEGLEVLSSKESIKEKAPNKDPESGRPKKKRPFEIPDDFKVTDSMRDWARETGHPSPDSEIGKFIDNSKKRGQMWVDWPAAFRNWLRKAKEIHIRDGTTTSGQGPPKIQRQEKDPTFEEYTAPKDVVDAFRDAVQGIAKPIPEGDE